MKVHVVIEIEGGLIDKVVAFLSLETAMDHYWEFYAREYGIQRGQEIDRPMTDDYYAELHTCQLEGGEG
jgi:hypothetical protein